MECTTTSLSTSLCMNRLVEIVSDIEHNVSTDFRRIISS